MEETSQHIEEFEGRRVVEYDPESGLGDPALTCPRLATMFAYEVSDAPSLSGARKVAMVVVVLLTLVGVVVWSWWALLFGGFALSVLATQPRQVEIVDLHDHWAKFLAEPRVHEVEALVLGPWFKEIDEGVDAIVAQLTSASAQLPNLRAIFLGDIVPEECEISWIEQGDITPLLAAFPRLETLVVRGGNGLRFSDLSHAHLRKLVVQSGGLAPETIADLTASSLPSLEHLELWLGDENYGFSSTIDELRPLWSPSRFEALQTLALRNCALADEIAEELATQPEAVSRLDRLDLSLGTLSDLGAQALYNNPAVLQLDSLDVRHHYLSDDWMAKLESLPIEVDVSEPQGYVEPSDDGDERDERYVAISE